MPARHPIGPCPPFELDLGALTVLTRLELRGYESIGPETCSLTCKHLRKPGTRS